MLNNKQEKQIKDAVYEAWKSTACTQSDMFLAAIKAYDKIVNPPVVDDTDWDKVIKDLEFMAYYSDSHQEKTLQKVIDFLKSHTKH